MLDVKAIAGKLRDEHLEKRIVAELEGVPQADRLRFILELGEQPQNGCFAASLVLLQKTVDERDLLVDALVKGLHRADATTIKYWVEALLHKLGLKRIVKIIEQEARLNPSIATKIVYHLPKWLNPENREQQEFFRRMKQLV